MAEPGAPQRLWRAPCPSCGAPVEFRSAQSTHAICAYCRSTVVREGEVLRRIGQMAELFDDHSLLQLGAAGRIDGQAFQLVGRLQYRYGDGTWTEWHALLDDGASAWLSEDNGAYVFSRPLPPQGSVPPAAQFRVGASSVLDGQPVAVSAHTRATLIAAQGELPRLPPLGEPFDIVELRTQGGDAAAQRVFSIDYGSTPPTLTEGRAVQLADLALTGLKDEAARETSGRQFACPHCGAPVAPRLDSTQSLTCGQCHSLIDISDGVGGELRHAVQRAPAQPMIALGSVGRFDGADWQVVGFQRRRGRAPDDDESFAWEEYLLYNATGGFSFLVHSEDGWSRVRPLTGAPRLLSGGTRAVYDHVTYTQQWRYRAETTEVQGEFYWQVRRGQVTQNRDYAAGERLLSSEQAEGELTWSGGRRISARAVAAAFRLSDPKALDAHPLSATPRVGIGTIVLVVLALILLQLLFERCSQCDPRTENCGAGSARSGGGSFGGYSAGGGHK